MARHERALGREKSNGKEKLEKQILSHGGDGQDSVNVWAPSFPFPQHTLKISSPRVAWLGFSLH